MNGTRDFDWLGLLQEKASDYRAGEILVRYSTMASNTSSQSWCLYRPDADYGFLLRHSIGYTK